MDNFTEINDQVGKTKKFLSGPKIIFAILGIVILIEVVYAARVLSTPVSPAPPVIKKETVVSPGKIYLNTAKKSFTLNETIPVSVMIDSGGHSLDGADLIIRFDPKALEATPGSLIAGSIFDEYPLLSVDAKAGIISASGVSSLRPGFKDVGQFIIVGFKAKVKGNTSLTIDFTKDSTSDSNLVEKGTSKDILESVDNLDIDIQ